MPRSRTLAFIAISFVAGALASRMLPVAVAQAPAPVPLQAQIIDVTALDDADLGPIIPNTELRSKTFVASEHGTVAVQQGNVNKHFHAVTDEIQYIVAGSGTMWLGDSQRQIKAGDLIVIPRGTHHAGTMPTTGRFKAIAIKLPPQIAGDTKFVQ